MAFRGAKGVKNTSSGSRAPARESGWWGGGVTAGDDGVFVCKSEALPDSTGPTGYFSGGGGLFLGSCQLSSSTILRVVQSAPLLPGSHEAFGRRFPGSQAGGREKCLGVVWLPYKLTAQEL